MRGSRWWAALCFFFQAEDGIRDGHVTGVQTCALPISDERARRRGATWDLLASSVPTATATAGSFIWTVTGPPTAGALIRVTGNNVPVGDKIGRASCRERGEIWEGAGAWKDGRRQ